MSSGLNENPLSEGILFYTLFTKVPVVYWALNKCPLLLENTLGKSVSNPWADAQPLKVVWPWQTRSLVVRSVGSGARPPEPPPALLLTTSVPQDGSPLTAQWGLQTSISSIAWGSVRKAGSLAPSQSCSIGNCTLTRASGEPGTLKFEKHSLS